MRQTKSFDLTVIGGGIIGLTTAWQAHKQGLKTLLVDRYGITDPLFKKTSSVAAGMIAPISEFTATEPQLLKLAQKSAELYPELVRTVTAASEDQVDYRKQGTLLLARDVDDLDHLKRELALRQQVGLAAELLNSSQTRKLEPALTRSLAGSLLINDDHLIDPVSMLAATAKAYLKAGGQVRTHSEVTEINISQGQVTGITLSSGESVISDSVLVAAGHEASRFASTDSSLRLRLRPVKGQILALYDPLHQRRKLCSYVLRGVECYLVPRLNGHYLLGATSEEQGLDHDVTTDAVFKLLRAGYELLPELIEIKLATTRVGFRPASEDGLPIIGEGTVKGLIWACGHYRHGVMLAPITAKLITEYLTSGKWADLAKPFSPARFTL